MARLVLLLIVFSPALAGNSVDVRIDPRFELVGVLGLLSDYQLVTRHQGDYYRAAQEHFKNYRDHEAVKTFTALRQQGFAFDRVPATFIALTYPYLEIAHPIPDRVTEVVSVDQLEAFFEACTRFMDESGFEAFLAAQGLTYRTVITGTTAEVKKAVTGLRRYSGERLRGAVVILSPLFHDGGFAAQQEEGGMTRAYAFIGPQGLTAGKPDFGNAGRLAPLIQHEFSHTFVNPLFEGQAQAWDALAHLFEPIKQQMEANAYPTWEITVNEHVVRAVTTRLTWLERGEAAGKAELARHQKRGFAYLEPLLEALEGYEANRDRYPNFASFYPQLPKALNPAKVRHP